MYLSQLIVNPRSRSARIDLADRYELHRTLMNAFPEDLPADERVLYRVEDKRDLPIVAVIVQSHSIPEWETVDRLYKDGYLADMPQVRQIAPHIVQDDRLPFRLQANPTVKQNGKRHAIYNDADLMSWLNNKGDQHGFSCDILDVKIAKLGKKHGKKRLQTWHAVQFDGLLQITEPTTFLNAVKLGIGSAKAFGFGLLSIPHYGLPPLK